MLILKALERNAGSLHDYAIAHKVADFERLLEAILRVMQPA
jgi:hypothetical protein